MKSQLAPNHSSLPHNVEMELHFSDAINLHPELEIPVSITCQRMETVDQEIASDLESSIFFGTDSKWLSRLAGIELNFEIAQPTGSNRFSRLAHVHTAQCNHHHLPLCEIPILFLKLRPAADSALSILYSHPPFEFEKFRDFSFSAFIN